jgi:hypothetical protein
MYGNILSLTLAFFLFFSFASLQAAPSPLAGLVEVKKSYQAGRMEEARRLLAPFLVNHAKDPLVQFLAGGVSWKENHPEQAARHWKRALDLDPASPAKEMLEMVAPQLIGECFLVEEDAQLREVFAFLADFRRQREVEKALANFTIRKGLSLQMKQSDWQEFMRFLVHQKYLKRPGGPPTGKGAYLSDAEGNLRSSVYGSWKAAELAPAALKDPAGFCAPPSAIVRSIRARDPGALEFGLDLLTGEDIARWSRQMGGAVLATRSPWEIDAVLGRLDQLSRRASTLPPSLRPWLSGIARRNRGVTRWWALALERRFQVPSSMPIRAMRLPAILSELRQGRVPIEAGELALETFGKRSGKKMVSLLESGSELDIDVLLELAARLDRGTVNAFLIEQLASKKPRWQGRKRQLRGVLTRISGQDLGAKPAAWRRWMEKRK